MTERKKKRFSFRMGLALYILVFMVLSAVALTIFYNYIAAFEASRPTQALEAYKTRLMENGTDAVDAALSVLDPNIRAPEENRQWAAALLEEASFPRISSLSSPDKVVYGVRARDEQVGTVTLTATGKGSYGFTAWELAEESYDFSAFTHRSEVTIPAGYGFYINGVLQGSDCVTDDAIPYESLADFYDRYENLPYLVHYESGLYVDDVETSIRDDAGNILTPDQLNEAYYLNNCPEHIRQLADEFIPVFLGLYVDFSSNLYNSYYYNFMQLRPLVLTDSQLHRRMEQAIGSFGYTTTNAVRILSIETHMITRLSEDRYLADLSYETEITGMGDPVVTTDNIRLVLYEHKDYLMAEALYNY